MTLAVAIGKWLNVVKINPLRYRRNRCVIILLPVLMILLPLVRVFFWTPYLADLGHHLTHNQRVVLTLSSFAGRLEQIEPTLRSLLDQTLSAHAIYLNIPRAVDRIAAFPRYSNFSDLPPFLLQMMSKYSGGQRHRQQHASNLKTRKPHLIVQLTEDYGPSTKLLPTLLKETDPETILISVEDDVVYHPHTVSQLVFSLISINKDELRSRSGKQKGLVSNRYYAPTWWCEEWWGWPLKRPILRWIVGECRGVLGAFSGAAYYRWFFDNRNPVDDRLRPVDGPGGIFDYSQAPKGCRLHDDVWISGYLWWKSGVRPFTIQPSFKSVQRHRPWDDLSVHLVERGEQDYRDPCIEYFNYFN